MVSSPWFVVHKTRVTQVVKFFTVENDRADAESAAYDHNRFSKDRTWDAVEAYAEFEPDFFIIRCYGQSCNYFVSGVNGGGSLNRSDAVKFGTEEAARAFGGSLFARNMIGHWEAIRVTAESMS